MKTSLNLMVMVVLAVFSALLMTGCGETADPGNLAAKSSIAITGDVSPTANGATFHVCLTNPNPGTVSKNVKANIFINPNRKLEVFAETTVGTNITSWLYLDIPNGMKIGTVTLCQWDVENNWIVVPIDPVMAKNPRSIDVGDILAQTPTTQNQRYLYGTLVPK